MTEIIILCILVSVVLFLPLLTVLDSLSKLKKELKNNAANARAMNTYRCDDIANLSVRVKKLEGQKKK